MSAPWPGLVPGLVAGPSLKASASARKHIVVRSGSCIGMKSARAMPRAERRRSPATIASAATGTPSRRQAHRARRDRDWRRPIRGANDMNATASRYNRSAALEHPNQSRPQAPAPAPTEAPVLISFSKCVSATAKQRAPQTDASLLRLRHSRLSGPDATPWRCLGIRSVFGRDSDAPQSTVLVRKEC